MANRTVTTQMQAKAPMAHARLRIARAHARRPPRPFTMIERTPTLGAECGALYLLSVQIVFHHTPSEALNCFLCGATACLLVLCTCTR